MGRIWGTVKYLLICYNKSFSEEIFRERLGVFLLEKCVKFNNKIQYL